MDKTTKYFVIAACSVIISGPILLGLIISVPVLVTYVHQYQP